MSRHTPHRFKRDGMDHTAIAFDDKQLRWLKDIICIRDDEMAERVLVTLTQPLEEIEGEEDDICRSCYDKFMEMEIPDGKQIKDFFDWGPVSYPPPVHKDLNMFLN